MATLRHIRLKIEDVVHPDFSALASDFECAICCNLFDDPVQLLCSNRHIFCTKCVRDGAFQSCPMCLDPLPKTGVKFVALHEPAGNPHCHRMMMKLKCRCPHHNGPVFEECITATAGAAGKQDDQDGSSSGGAASAGTGGSSAAAAASSRAAYPKKRPRADSDGGGLDSDRDAAPTKCPWGSDLKGEYGDLITKHLSVCPLHPVACPRKGCGAVVRRWALEKHALVCRANFEACSICGELVRPEDMAAHRTAAAETHVQILEQKLLERNAVITSQQLARSPDSIVWSLKTADLFSCCKKRGDFVSSEPFCVKGYGPVKLDLHGAGFKNDNKPEAGSDEFMGLFCERAAPYPKGPRERFEINFSSLRVVSGSRSDTKTSTPINVLHEKKNDSLEPGFGWATMTDLKISKIKQLEEITIRLQIIGVEVALRTV